MNDDKINYQLLANPYHLKLSKKNNNLDDSIFLLLKKRFPGNILSENDKVEILKKIDFLFIEATISNIVTDTINSIINYIEDESLL